MAEITLILHNIRSTHNVGAIFRSAEGFAVKKIVLSGYTPYPKLAVDSRLPHIANKLHGQIHKTALGAESLVPFEYSESLDSWLHANSSLESPLQVYALEQASNSTPIQHFIPTSPYAVLLGEEVKGIDPHYLRLCDDIIEIPMSGIKESFNVSVACGIALYALRLNSDTLPTNNSY